VRAGGRVTRFAWRKCFKRWRVGADGVSGQAAVAVAAARVAVTMRESVNRMVRIRDVET